MTGYDRFMAALRREEPDRVPLWELIVNEPTLSAWGATSLEEFVEQEELDGITIFEDMPTRSLEPGEGEDIYRLPADEARRRLVDDWAIVWETTTSGLSYPVAGPIRSEEDLRHYEPPDPGADDRLASLRLAVKRFKGRKAILFLTHDGFEFSHYLRSGMARLFVDYIENPRLVHALAEVVVDYKIRLMQRAIEEGADVIVSGDDYAGRKRPLMSPRHFEAFILPYLRRSIEAAHDMGVPYIKHTDGNVWPLLDMMVEAGIDGIDPLEPIAGMDIGEVKRRFGDRIAVVGNVDCTNLLPHGTPEEVEEAVKETIAKAAHGGGHILASSNSIHPAVRPENYAAMVQAARRWGVYPLDRQMVEEYRQKNYAGGYGGSWATPAPAARPAPPPRGR
jgi:uroporphyrinogen decarboxylase